MIINDVIFDRERYVGQSVRSLQTMLRTIASLDPEMPMLIPDGFYGPETSRAVSYFQRKHRLPVTGQADGATHAAILEAFEEALIIAGPSQQIYAALDPGQAIMRGDRNYHVWLIQAMLNVIADKYHTFRGPEVNGIYDLPTATQVSRLQRLTGLPETGNMDKITWKHLVRLYDLAAGNGEIE